MPERSGVARLRSVILRASARVAAMPACARACLALLPATSVFADAILQAFAAASAARGAAASASVTSLPDGSISAQRQIGRHLQWAEVRGGVVNSSSGETFARCRICARISPHQGFLWLTGLADLQVYADALRGRRIILLCAAHKSTAPLDLFS
jgi:hypothetical protein